uniref:G-protein coupled receptors family 1 profile domain-containing protein n=2 Tax=Latimeria chalumnae TaxID=7897 RepID=H3BGU5_LATCH
QDQAYTMDKLEPITEFPGNQSLFESDFSNDTDTSYEIFEEAASIIAATTYSIAFFLGVIGNILVIWNAGFKMRRTATVTYILHLSVVDLILTALLPFSISHIVLDFHWPFGTFLCKLLGLIVHLNMFASVFLLTVMSLDRCISVTHPIWTQNHRSTRTAGVVCMVVWILSVFLSIPFFVIREATASSWDTELIICHYTFHKKDLLVEGYVMVEVAVVVVRFVLAFVVPFAIIAVCYCTIMVKLKHRWKRTPEKSSKIVATIILTFFICWLPYHVLAIWHAFSEWPSIVTTLFLLATSMAYLNSCINPILYLAAGQGVRSQLKRKMHDALQTFLGDELIANRAPRVQCTSSASDTKVTFPKL